MLKGLGLWLGAWPMVPPQETQCSLAQLWGIIPNYPPKFSAQLILGNPGAESVTRIFKCDLEEPGKEIMTEVL